VAFINLFKEMKKIKKKSFAKKFLSAKDFFILGRIR